MGRQYNYKLIYTLILSTIIILSSSRPSGLVTTMVTGNNIVVNGDFSDGMVNWDFYEDFPWDGPSSKADMEVVDGRAYLHASIAVVGNLKQDFTKGVYPSYFAMDYERVNGHTCGDIGVYLYNQEDTFFRFIIRGDNYEFYDPHLAIVEFITKEKLLVAKSDPTLESGKLELNFNYTINEMTIIISGTEYNSLPFSHPDQILTYGIRIFALNACWDGRDDTYAYFDNLILYEEINFDKVTRSIETTTNPSYSPSTEFSNERDIEPTFRAIMLVAGSVVVGMMIYAIVRYRIKADKIDYQYEYYRASKLRISENQLLCNNCGFIDDKLNLFCGECGARKQ